MFYHVQIHQRVPVEEGVEFLQTVDQVLNDPRGWGLRFTRVPLDKLLTYPSDQAFIIRLTPKEVLNKEFQEFAAHQLSVANMTDRVIYINACRWTGDCPNNSQLSLDEYRQYVINHEVGHMLGKHHPTELPDQLHAPVMIQQTLGIKHFYPNPWPTTFDRNKL